MGHATFDDEPHIETSSDQRLVIMRNWEDTRERLRGITGILQHLARIAKEPMPAMATAKAK